VSPVSKLDVVGEIRGDYLYLRRQDSISEGGELALYSSNAEINRNGRIIIDNYDQGLRIFRWKDNLSEYTEYAIFQPTKTYFGMQGNVGIGTAAPSEKLHVAGNVLATAFFYSSDEKLKENIAPLRGSLEKILALQGVSFNWKESGERGIGLIAQEVEKVYPELVHGSEGNKSVSYGNLVGALIEAIKEQQKQIDNLKKQVDELREKNN